MILKEHKDNKLTEEEKLFFNENGYLIVKNAFDKKLLLELLEQSDSLVKSDSEFYNDADILSNGNSYLKLVTLSSILPKIVGLLGWNIWINHSHLNYHPTNSSLDTINDFNYGWHRDGGRIEEDLNEYTIPCISLKVAFFLTGTQEEYSGSTLCIPGSHKTKQKIPYDYSLPKDAIPITLPEGSALIFNPRIIHSVRSPNLTTKTRKAIFLQWAYRWLQPVDPHSIHKIKSEVNNSYLRQLLGLSTNLRALKEEYAVGRSGYYYPNDQEVPLKEYMDFIYN